MKFDQPVLIFCQRHDITDWKQQAIQLLMEGCTLEEIGYMLKVHPKTISAWICRFSQAHDLEKGKEGIINAVYRVSLERWDAKPNTVLNAVKGILEAQTEKGIKKYGESVKTDNLSLEEWINHAQEETADTLVYLECIKQKLKCV